MIDLTALDTAIKAGERKASLDEWNRIGPELQMMLKKTPPTWEEVWEHLCDIELPEDLTKITEYYAKAVYDFLTRR